MVLHVSYSFFDDTLHWKYALCLLISFSQLKVFINPCKDIYKIPP